jgi:hypothetical protein
MATNPIIKLQKTKDKINRYQATFASDEGQWVLADLKRAFDRPSYIPRKQMTFDEVAYNEGIRSVIKFIESQMDSKQIERINKLMEQENE